MKFVNYRGLWDANTTYALGDTALYRINPGTSSVLNNYIIGKNSSTNSGGQPGIDSSWIIITTTISTSWSATTTYESGKILFSSDNGTVGANNYHWALQTSRGIEPNPNPSFWKGFVAATNSPTPNSDSRIHDFHVDYKVGDTVCLGATNLPGGFGIPPKDGKMFICIQNTGIDNASTYPLASNGHLYWALLFTLSPVSF
jgi:hypothetical protein